MAERITRQQVEVLASGIGQARVTQQYIETLAEVRIFFLDAESTLNVQQGIKVLAGDIYVTRQQVEVVANGFGKLRVTRQCAEILSKHKGSLNPPTAYANLAEGEDYFATRLHTEGWPFALPKDRQDALILATRLINTLNFKDHKHTVYELLQAGSCGQNIGSALDNECITEDELQAANLAQELEFPRGADTEVPQAIKDASMEIAEAVLAGIDPELELEKLSSYTQKMEGASISSDRRYIPVEHLINLIPSAVAWSWIKPFLMDDEAIKITRIT